MSVHLQRALELARLRQSAQAEEVLRRALREEPRNAAVHRLLAWCLAMQDRLPQAQRQAQEAIRLQPDCDMAYHAFGWILFRQGRWQEAEKAIREAIRLAPEDADHFFLLAQLFAQQGRWRESVEAARQGRQIDPRHVNCGTSLAQALRQMKRYQEAQEILQTTRITTAERAGTHGNQQSLVDEQRQLEKSLYAFQESARVEPVIANTQLKTTEIRTRFNIYNIIAAVIFLLFITYHVINYAIDLFNFIVWGHRPRRLPK